MSNQFDKLASSPRVYLRRPHQDDVDVFLEAVDRSSELHRNWVIAPTTTEQFRQYCMRSMDRDFLGLFICLEDDDSIAGVCNLNQIYYGYFQNATLGYYAMHPHEGHGFMHEGLQLVVDYAFDELKLHRLEANIQPNNQVSIELVKRCGFQHEGFSPRFLFIDGVWADHERWALTIEDRQRLPKN